LLNAYQFAFVFLAFVRKQAIFSRLGERSQNDVHNKKSEVEKVDDELVAVEFVSLSVSNSH